MQDRTIACGLATLDSPDQNLLANVSTLVTNESVFLHQLAEKTNAELQNSYYPNHLQDRINLETQPELDTMLLSNFADYHVIEEKIMSSTQNMSSHRDGQQLLNFGKSTFLSCLNSEQDESNLLNNLRTPIQQTGRQIQQVLQSQFQTEIQSNLYQDLPEQIINVHIEEEKAEFVFQKSSLQLAEGLFTSTYNGCDKQQEMPFRSDAIKGMSQQKSQICLFSNNEANIEQRLLQNAIEKVVQRQQFQMVAQVEPTEYSLNSDNLVGMIQDNMTNTEVRTEFISKNNMQNEFDFSEQAEIILQEPQDQNKQVWNQESQRMQYLQTSFNSICQKSMQENNNLSLEVNINSESKNNIILERRELSFYSGTAQDVYEIDNNMTKEDSLYQNVNQENYEQKQQGKNMDIAPEQNMQENITEDQRIDVDIGVSYVQVEKKVQNTFQEQKSEFSFKAYHQIQNQDQEHLLNFLANGNQQKSNAEAINFCQQIFQPEVGKQDVGQLQSHIPLNVEVQQICFNQNNNTECFDIANSQKGEKNNQILQIYSQLPIEKTVQAQEIGQQDIMIFEQTNQIVPLSQHHTVISSQNLQILSTEFMMRNINPEAPLQTSTINFQQNINLKPRIQSNAELFNRNQEMSSEGNEGTGQAKSQSDPAAKPIIASNLNYSQGNREDNKVSRMPESEQKPKFPFINISYDNTQGQEKIKTEHIQLIPNNFNNSVNVYPCISININRDNQISLNLFRNYNNNQSNFQSSKNERPWERKVEQSLAENYNNSRQTQRALKNNQTQKKQSQEMAIQTSAELNDSFTIAHKKLLSQQQSMPSQESQSYESQGQSMGQKLNRIRKIADYYMISGYIQQQVHKQFEETLKTHVLIRFSPQPIDDLGREIFKDGLVMVALVKMLCRSSKTPFLQNYIFEYMQSAFSIQSNNYLFIQQSKKAKTNFENYLVQNYEKKVRQQQMRGEHPVKRTEIASTQIKLQKKLTLQSSNIAINEKSCVQTRRKQNNLAMQSEEKIKVVADNIQLERAVVQKESMVQKSIKEVKSQQFKTVEKVSTKPLEQIIHENSLEGKKEKQNNQLFEKNKTQKKIQKVPIVMQQESPSNSLQEIDHNNFQQNINKSEEEDKSSKVQKASRSKYANLKNNSQQKNECAKQVEACLQNRNTKFNQLYERYKQIREIKAKQAYFPPPLPSEDKIASITKSALVESKERVLGVERKKSKHVQFIDQPLEMRKEEADGEGEDDGVKKGKRKKSKKNDNPATEEQLQTSKIKKSKK